MAMNCCRPSIPYFGKHDGLLIYKIVIEYDLIIEKVGDVWNLVGLVDIGEKQHFSYMQKDKKEELAIHAFQFVSQCFTGFRRVSALQPVIFYHIKKILIENDICDLSNLLKMPNSIIAQHYLECQARVNINLTNETYMYYIPGIFTWRRLI